MNDAASRAVCKTQKWHWLQGRPHPARLRDRQQAFKLCSQQALRIFLRHGDVRRRVIMTTQLASSSTASSSAARYWFEGGFRQILVRADRVHLDGIRGDTLELLAVELSLDVTPLLGTEIGQV